MIASIILPKADCKAIILPCVVFMISGALRQKSMHVASAATPSMRHRCLLAAAIGLGWAIPIVPGLLLAGRSNVDWVRRQATLAAWMQAILLAAVVAGTAVCRLAVHTITNGSGFPHRGLHQVLATVQAAPIASTFAAIGGLLAGAAIAVWWVGNLLAAIGALRGDSLGWPRLGRTRRTLA